MAFTVNDLQDLTRLLLERPEWLSEVRRIVLTDELLALPRELAEAQRRTDERFAELAEAQRRTEERLDRLTEVVQQLTTSVRTLETSVRTLETSVRTLENQMAAVRGRMLETEYRDKAASFFGIWVRKPRVVSISDIWDDLEDRLSRQELEQLLPLDLLVRGQLSRQQKGGDIWLAVEISSVIDTRDVERAVERAALLRKAGFRAVPVVAGHGIANDAIADQIAQQHVAALMNGLNAGWEAALQRVVSEIES